METSTKLNSGRVRQLAEGTIICVNVAGKQKIILHNSGAECFEQLLMIT